MDWEDEYARKHQARIDNKIERAIQLGAMRNHQQYETFTHAVQQCMDPDCLVNGEIEQLCFDCNSFYTTIDETTKKFIKLELEILKDQDERQQLYGTWNQQ